MSKSEDGKEYVRFRVQREVGPVQDFQEMCRKSSRSFGSEITVRAGGCRRYRQKVRAHVRLNSGGTTENLRPELSAQGVFLSPKTAPFSRKLQTKEFDRI